MAVEVRNEFRRFLPMEEIIHTSLWFTIPAYLQWKLAKWLLVPNKPNFGRNYLWQEVLEHFQNPLFLLFWSLILIAIVPALIFGASEILLQFLYARDYRFVGNGFIFDFLYSVYHGKWLPGYSVSTVTALARAYYVLVSNFKLENRNPAQNSRLRWKFSGFFAGNVVALLPFFVFAILILNQPGPTKLKKEAMVGKNSSAEKITQRRLSAQEHSSDYPKTEPQPFKRLPF